MTDGERIGKVLAKVALAIVGSISAFSFATLTVFPIFNVVFFVVLLCAGCGPGSYALAVERALPEMILGAALLALSGLNYFVAYKKGRYGWSLATSGATGLMLWPPAVMAVTQALTQVF